MFCVILGTRTLVYLDIYEARLGTRQDHCEYYVFISVPYCFHRMHILS